MIKLREYQTPVIEKLRPILKIRKKIVVVAPTRSGKCLGKNTPVLMYDGTIKMSQNIKSGDVLMGPDSKKRIVTSIIKGKEQLYKIIPTKGNSFVCNESHILSLVISNNKYRCLAGDGNFYKGNEIANITIKDYLKSNKTFKWISKLYRSKLIEFKKKDLNKSIDPYFLGIWLGDGTSRLPEISNPEKEIHDYCYSYAKKRKLSIRISYGSIGCPSLNFTSGRKNSNGRKGGSNNILNGLKELNLLLNKHIPFNYKTSSKEDRLQLLAGLLDTDGYYHKKTYEIVTKYKQLNDDILFLCRSLGYAAYSKIKKVKLPGKNIIRDYYRISISGNLFEIPCKIKRKKPEKRIRKNDVLRTAFKVEKIEKGDYYGFEIEGNDRLFLLGDFTVTHNTVIFSYIAQKMQLAGKRVLIITHRKEILEQIAKELSKFDISPGIIATKSPLTYNLIQVGMVQTICNLLKKQERIKKNIKSFELIENFDLVIWDECHHQKSKTWNYVFNFFTKAIHLGFSATPIRLDGKGLNENYNCLIQGKNTKWMIENFWLSKPKHLCPTSPLDSKKIKKIAGDFDTKSQSEEMIKSYVVGDVLKYYREFFNGAPIVVFCCNIKHAEVMYESYKNDGWNPALIHGQLKKTTREEIMNGFKNSKFNQLISVDLIGEGIDVPNCYGVQMLRKTASLSLYLQQAARGLTPVYAKGYNLEDKNERSEALFKEKPYSIILDHVGNYWNHGPIEKERKWTLRGKDKKEKLIEKKTCPKCFFSWEKNVSSCPNCGHDFIKQQMQQKEHEMVQLKEELVEVSDLNPEKVGEMVDVINKIKDTNNRNKAMFSEMHKAISRKETDLQKKLKALCHGLGYNEFYPKRVWEYLRKTHGPQIDKLS